MLKNRQQVDSPFPFCSFVPVVSHHHEVECKKPIIEQSQPSSGARSLKIELLLVYNPTIHYINNDLYL